MKNIYILFLFNSICLASNVPENAPGTVYNADQALQKIDWKQAFVLAHHKIALKRLHIYETGDAFPNDGMPDPQQIKKKYSYDYTCGESCKLPEKRRPIHWEIAHDIFENHDVAAIKEYVNGTRTISGGTRVSNYGHPSILARLRIIIDLARIMHDTPLEEALMSILPQSIHEASKLNFLPMIKKILDEQAESIDSKQNLHWKCSNDTTPLQDAISYCAFEAQQYLIDRGATIDITALKKAAFHHPRCLAMLADRVLAIEHQQHSWELFANAARMNHVESIFLLHDMGFSVNAQLNDNSALFLLYESCYRNYPPAAVQALIDCGADVHQKQESGSTPLYALDLSIPELVHILVQEGLDVNSQNDNGDTALHFQCGSCRGNNKVIIALLQAGTDITLRNKQQFTPYACYNKQYGEYNADVIEAFLQHGLNPNRYYRKPDLYGYRGHTVKTWPLEEAIQYNNVDAVAVLLRYGAIITQEALDLCNQLYKEAQSDPRCNSLLPKRTQIKQMLDAKLKLICLLKQHKKTS